MRAATQTQLNAAAQQLAAARLKPQVLERLDYPPANLEQAYQCQAILHKLLTEAGSGQIAGHKIGCTTKIMQQYLAISSPCAGKLFEPTVHQCSAELSRESFCNPGVECEIAVRLVTDLYLQGLDPLDIVGNREHVAAAVGGCMASIELVDSRWLDYSAIDAASLIADDFFSAGAILGEQQPVDPLQLDKLSGQMLVNGQRVGRGSGVDILAHPLDALVWLARLRESQHQPLRNGEFVTLGSVVQTQWISAGDHVQISFDTLGEAELLLR